MQRVVCYDMGDEARRSRRVMRGLRRQTRALGAAELVWDTWKCDVA